MSRKINIFIDGSCRNVKNKELAVGGWGYIITDSKFNIIEKEYGKLREGNQDSTRAELEALYQALLKVITYKNCKFHIYTDYEATVDCLTGFAERKANRDFWDLIEPLCLKLAGNYRVSHLISHYKNPEQDKILSGLNYKADRLAKAGSNSLTKAPVAI